MRTEVEERHDRCDPGCVEHQVCRHPAHWRPGGRYCHGRAVCLVCAPLSFSAPDVSMLLDDAIAALNVLDLVLADLHHHTDQDCALLAVHDAVLAAWADAMHARVLLRAGPG